MILKSLHAVYFWNIFHIGRMLTIPSCCLGFLERPTVLLCLKIKSLYKHTQIITQSFTPSQIPVLFIEEDFRTFLCDHNIAASYCWSWEVGQIFQGINTWKAAEQVNLFTDICFSIFRNQAF